MFGFLSFVLLSILIGLVYLIIQFGVRKFGKKVFYVVSFHWLIKIIIKYRMGGYEQDNFETRIHSIIENDAEMVD